jgi:hypothetical protein
MDFIYIMDYKEKYLKYKKKYLKLKKQIGGDVVFTIINKDNPQEKLNLTPDNVKVLIEKLEGNPQTKELGGIVKNYYTQFTNAIGNIKSATKVLGGITKSILNKAVEKVSNSVSQQLSIATGQPVVLPTQLPSMDQFKKGVTNLTGKDIGNLGQNTLDKLTTIPITADKFTTIVNIMKM